MSVRPATGNASPLLDHMNCKAGRRHTAQFKEDKEQVEGRGEFHRQIHRECTFKANTWWNSLCSTLSDVKRNLRRSPCSMFPPFNFYHISRLRGY